MDWQEIYRDIEDKLLPHFQCDIWERGLYYFLLSQSYVRGHEAVTVPLSKISSALRCSDFKARKTIRLLADKGCIELEQTRSGHSVRVLLPDELSLPDQSTREKLINFDNVDFYKNRKYLSSILKREKCRCFYCLREIEEESCELDHVESQLNGGSNTYRNIVASCHRCNTKKQGNSAEDHIRQLYRKELLSEDEFEGRLRALGALRDGQLKPEI